MFLRFFPSSRLPNGAPAPVIDGKALRFWWIRVTVCCWLFDQVRAWYAVWAACFQLMPWNVDTISSDGFSKTVINTKPRPKDENLTEEEREERMRSHVKKYEKEMKQFGMLQKYEDSKRFLQEHMHLVCEDTANYLVIWAINLEMEEVSFLCPIMLLPAELLYSCR